ncbi:MAG: hypothetical protein C0600_02055 [Ignavibacteria bacterium]|nr:MAG: hypothetical protein C0600_02055 [Ignavibacteria bacterium]
MNTTVTNIDIHHHMLPDVYVEAMNNNGHIGNDLPAWTPENSLNMMDAMGIEKAILSVPSPAASDGELAHAINLYASQIKASHPGRFGAFATIPFPDVHASVLEITHALNDLALDGVVLFSNAGGAYLGDPEYDAILAELNNRRAMVLVHASDRPGIEDHDGANPFVEYPTDVSRAYARLVYSHAFERFRDIRWVFAGAGGVVPFLAERIGKLHYTNGKKLRWGRIIVDMVTKRNSGLDLAKSVSYDTADIGPRFTLFGLSHLVDCEQIRFGSNFPFSDETTIGRLIEALTELNATAVR